ncbi:hypothetical protein Ancab_022558 [Ancistrocladus abbreviatus]
MAGKAVVSVISIILVVGVVIGVVAVVKHNGNKSGGKDVSPSMKTVNALCAPAMYKDQCINSLGTVSKNHSATPQDYIQAGLKMILDEVSKVVNLTDTFVPKANNSKEPQRVKMAIDDCKDLINLAIDKVHLALNQVGDPKIYKEETKTWDLRLWLSDIITYQTNCVDEFEEAQDSEFHSIMQNGTVNATQLTMSILDIVTTFSKSLGDMGYDLNATKLVEDLKDDATKGSRRLLGMPMTDDGFPAWMSAGDRHLLAAADPGAAGVKPNAVVALDGSGQFKSIKDALKAYNPKAQQGRYVIYVKAGVYKEEVLVDKNMANILMYGDGPEKTKVTGRKNVAIDKLNTMQTASFAVQANGFMCKNMGFENTAGPDGHQAVALRVNGEQAVFHNCRFDGYQDTLYTQAGSHFFRDCTISGTVDFIFGNGATLIQKSKIIVRLPNLNQFNAVTAQGREGPNEPAGIVLQGCDIVADPALNPHKNKVKTFLGRPWKPYARTVFMESTMGDFIVPEGYQPWQNDKHTGTAFYGEYANSGPGANTDRRVKWKNVKVLSKEEALTYTASEFWKGGIQQLQGSGVPVDLKLKA